MAQYLLPGYGDIDETVSAQLLLPGSGDLNETTAGSSDTPVNPGVGSIAITGYAPTVVQTANQAIAPSVGSLAITGHAPSVVRTGAEVVEASGGIFYEAPRIKRHRTVQEDRERLGIITKQVKKVLVAVAKASVDREATDAQAGGLLASALAMRGLQPAPQYEQFMQQERDRILSRDIERALRIRQRQYELDEDEREAEMLLM